MDLKTYLEETGIPIAVFARKIKVTPMSIYYIFQGKDMKLSTALKIELATGGKVKCKDLFSLEKVKEMMNPKTVKKKTTKPKNKKSLDKTKAK